MSRKFLDMKDVFDIILLAKKGRKLVDIQKEYPQYSFTTISRICSSRNNSASSKYAKYRKFIEVTESWPHFKEKFFIDFPQPQYWPAEFLKKLVRDSAHYSYRELIKKYELNFSEYVLKNLFESGEIKKYLKDILNKSAAEVKDKQVAEEKSSDFNEIAALIKKLKKLGAKEVIVKF